MTREQIAAALPVLKAELDLRIRKIENPTCDDLRTCLEHGIPINRCEPCWPLFLNHLAVLTFNYHMGHKRVIA